MSCGSHALYQDKGLMLMGEQSVVAETPSLLKVNQSVSIMGAIFQVYGRVCLTYNDGGWDEWYIQDNNAKGFWLSVDEGDYILQSTDKVELASDFTIGLTLGREVKQNNTTWIVTECDTATVCAIQGQLPEEIHIDESFDYWHLSGKGSELLTVEQKGNDTQGFMGQWIDPFEIETI